MKDLKFIPVRDSKGNSVQVTMGELFEKGDCYQLGGDVVFFTGMNRFLIALGTHVLRNDDIDNLSLTACCELLKERALEYLDENGGLFKLFGDNAFMQFDRKKMQNAKDVGTSFISVIASNSRDSKNFYGTGADSQQDEAIARNLFGYIVNHRGGKGTSGTFDGIVFKNAKGKPTGGCFRESIVKNRMQFYIMGKNVLETIILNISRNLDNLGVPSWELPKNSASDTEAIVRNNWTVLGRLFPCQVFLSLEKSEDGVSVFAFSNQDAFPYPIDREPSGKVVAKGDIDDEHVISINPRQEEGRRVVNLCKTKRIIDYLPGLSSATNKVRALSKIEDDRVTIWVGGEYAKGEFGKDLGMHCGHVSHCFSISKTKLLDSSFADFVSDCWEQAHKSYIEFGAKYCDFIANRNNVEFVLKDKKIVSKDKKVWSQLDAVSGVYWNHFNDSLQVAEKCYGSTDGRLEFWKYVRRGIAKLQQSAIFVRNNFDLLLEAKCFSSYMKGGAGMVISETYRNKVCGVLGRIMADKDLRMRARSAKDDFLKGLVLLSEENIITSDPNCAIPEAMVYGCAAKLENHRFGGLRLGQVLRGVCQKYPSKINDVLRIVSSVDIDDVCKCIQPMLSLAAKDGLWVDYADVLCYIISWKDDDARKRFALEFAGASRK